MKIEVLGSYGGDSLGYRSTCLLINDTVALDAGSLSRALPIERQVGVGSILLSHSHLDHTRSIPFFVENVFSRRDNSVDIYASSATIDAIRRYLLNNATWPDFTRIPNHLLPAVKLHEIQDEGPLDLDDVRYTPVPVDHLVPTYGFLIEYEGKTVLWSSDTGPTQRIWDVAQEAENLVAACIEVTFDNSLQQVADETCHLTPATLESELQKLDRWDIPVLIHHLKPSCVEQIEAEVAALDRPNLGFLEQGRVYEF